MFKWKSQTVPEPLPTLPAGEWYALDQYKIRRVLGRPKVTPSTETPVVLIHGFAANAITYRELQPALSERTDTHNLDLPGMGYSDRSHVEYSLEFYVKFIDDYLECENLKQVDLVGHSLGGAIVFLYALHRPERVRKLVLIAPLINFTRVQSGLLGRGLRAISLPYISKPIISLKGRWFAKLFLETVMLERHLITEQMIDDYYNPHRLKDSIRSLYQVNRMMADARNQKIIERLGELKAPCLVLWGEGDPLLPVEDAEHFRRDIPHVEIATYPGAGHMLMHERAPEVSARVAKFLFDEMG